MGGNQSSPYPSRNIQAPTVQTNTDLLSTPLAFNSVHGENITLLNGSRIAKRSESFCKGICFSNRPIVLGEKIIITFTEVSTNWSGVLRIGLTSVDPSMMRAGLLPRYACPDLTNKSGHWAKALNERYADQGNKLCFYVTREGTVMYAVNGQDKGPFLSGVTTTGPLWVMADIYGNTIAIEIQSGGLNNQSVTQAGEGPSNPPATVPRAPPPANDASGTSSHDPNARVVCPAVRYHANVNFTAMPLSAMHGRHISLLANNKIALRSTDDFCQGYVFTSRPIGVGEKIVIQILATALNYFGGLCFGVTSCDPLSLCPGDLPDDSDNLLDRGEYWVVNKDVCSDPSVGDELSFTLTNLGEVRYSRNSHHVSTLMHVDTSLPLWFFFDVYGNLQKIRVLGVTSRLTSRRSDGPTSGLSVNLPPSIAANPSSAQTPAQATPRGATNENAADDMVVEEPYKDDLITECTVCYESEVDSVIYTCGHMCMCYKCAMVVKSSSDALCPICRQPIKDVIKIYKS